MTERRCAAQHFGLWAIESVWFQRAAAAVRSGAWKPQADGDGIVVVAVEGQDGESPLFLVQDNIAIIDIQDQLTKRGSSFGGTSTVQARQAVRIAARDPDIQGIFLRVDSPGGTIDGTAELADEVYAARAQKPIRAFVDGLGASAAYWVTSQAERISASRVSEVGSVGAFAALIDRSKQMQEDGIEVIVFKTGPLKGAGVFGTQVTEEQRAYFQERVDDAFAEFARDVARGRGVSPSVVETWSSGRVWSAPKALQLGLIDAVETEDEAFDALRLEARNVVSQNDLRNRIAGSRIRSRLNARF